MFKKGQMNIWIILIVVVGIFGFGYYGYVKSLEGTCGMGFWKFCWAWSTESVNVVQGLWFALR